MSSSFTSTSCARCVVRCLNNSHVPFNTRLAHLHLQLRPVIVAAKKLPSPLPAKAWVCSLQILTQPAYPDASGSALTATIVLARVYHCSSPSILRAWSCANGTAHHLAVAPEVEDADGDAARAVGVQRQLAHVTPRVVPEGGRRDAAARQQGARDRQLQRWNRALRMYPPDARSMFHVGPQRTIRRIST